MSTFEPTAHGRGRARGDNSGVFDRVEVRFHLLIEAPPLVGQRHRARRAIEQPHIQPCFEAG